MTIKAICPECGLTADMAAFVTQGEHNQALAAALEIPALLGPRVVRYLGLFRPPSRALSGAKAVRLLTELRDVIVSGEIQRKGVTRPAPMGVWATALDQLLERPPGKLPLTGHGYLFEIVAGVADKTDADRERAAEEAARSGAKPPANLPPSGVVRERSTEDVLAEHQRLSQGKTSGRPSGNTQVKRGPHSLSELLRQAPGAEEDS